MPSQTELHSRRQYAIIEADREEGSLKTRNVPADEVQREVVTQRDETAFSVYVTLATCVHGRLDGPNSDLASLLIFEYEIHSKEENSVVKSLTTSFEFSYTSPGSPDVKAYAPYVRRKYNFSTGEVKHTHGIEGNASLNAGPGEIGTTLSKQKETAHEQQYFEKVESDLGYNDTQKRRDRISFFFSQNQSQKLGVTPFFRTAILLKRSDQVPFQAVFKLKFDGGFMYNASQTFKSVFGKVPDDPINFNPFIESLLGEVQIDDINQLGKYAHGRELDKSLAPIWGVDIQAGQ